MRQNEFKLAPEKIEASIITRKRKREGLVFKIRNVSVALKNSIKYLEIFFDTAGSYKGVSKKNQREGRE